MADGEIDNYQCDNLDWKVSLIDTGLNSMTGGRVKRMQPYIGDSTFLLTYGDGLADIDINSLIKFHKSHGKMITVTAVHPGARFGELDLDGDRVFSFKEKPQTKQDWINGGFFVFEPEFFELIESDDTILEKSPLEKAAEKGQLMAFKHNGFWQCMDTKRDRDQLESLWNKGNSSSNERFIVEEDREATNARLTLLSGVRAVIVSGLQGIVGVLPQAEMR
mgnify:CR=1 FL=1